jgi:hypothetical protein
VTSATQLISHSKIKFFSSVYFLIWQRLLKIQYTLHHRSEICEIPSIKSQSSRAFQQTPQFPAFSLFRFLMKILLNQSYTISPVITKPLWCTPTQQGFSKGPKATIRGCCGLRDLNVTNKANKLPSLIYGYIIRCLFIHSYLPGNLTSALRNLPIYT